MAPALTVLLGVLAVYVALPALADALLLLRRWSRGVSPQIRDAIGRELHVLVVVPAHNEGLLIKQTLDSLQGQTAPAGRFTVLVVADNCADDTAAVARATGVQVLERKDPARLGKNHAVRYAIEQYAGPWDTLLIIDADTIVAPGAVEALLKCGARTTVVQSFDGLSNEFENDLTTLAGLLARVRFELVLSLKSAAGVAIPLAGNGTMIGRDVLTRHPWDPVTVTEGWELYADYALAGIPSVLCLDARVYAQEARTLGQSESQRIRWTGGRLAVLRRTLGRIIRSPKLAFAQRVDLLAELSSLGPITRGALASLLLVFGAMSGVYAQGGGALLVAMLATGVLQPILYSVTVLRRHPDPSRVARAFLFLPIYVPWRLWLTGRLIFGRLPAAWTRTARHSVKGEGGQLV